MIELRIESLLRSEEPETSWTGLKQKGSERPGIPV